jgi:5-methylcytosine-specific restriction protein A
MSARLRMPAAVIGSFSSASSANWASMVSAIRCVTIRPVASLRGIGREHVLAAIAEYDRLGQEAFLAQHGYGEARDYVLVHEGKTYDSKAIVGVAHGIASGSAPLAASEFSGGEATVGRLLRGLGFVLRVGRDLSAERLAGLLARLDVNRQSGVPALYQPIILVWAFGRARRGLPRLVEWDSTEASLQELFARYGRPGEERGRAAYPAAALHRAGLWELEAGGEAPSGAHSSLTEGWFRTFQPRGGLAESVYDLIRDSSTARFEAIETLVTTYFAGTEYVGLLEEVGLLDKAASAQGDSVLPFSPLEEAYRLLCGIADRGRNARGGERAERTADVPVRSAAAREAVIVRSLGRCENPRCTGDIRDKTTSGKPILEVDHVHELGDDGADVPANMIALCPNCHATKTRGSSRETLIPELVEVARRRHEEMLGTQARSGS